jgi:hypothetical protein
MCSSHQYMYMKKYSSLMEAYIKSNREKSKMDAFTISTHLICICVCVYDRERERERTIANSVLL